MNRYTESGIYILNDVTKDLNDLNIDEFDKGEQKVKK